jgi:hypothetical protein
VSLFLFDKGSYRVQMVFDMAMPKGKCPCAHSVKQSFARMRTFTDSREYHSVSYVTHNLSVAFQSFLRERNFSRPKGKERENVHLTLKKAVECIRKALGRRLRRHRKVYFKKQRRYNEKTKNKKKKKKNKPLYSLDDNRKRNARHERQH